jgi:4-hydroxy-tetrahydrodipicolinate reductase
MPKLKIAVAGSGGRMGRALLEAVHGGDDVELAAALEAAGSPFLGKNAGELVGAPDRVTISADIGKSLAGCDALIDFTRPEGTLAHLAACHKLGVNMVIGTTGFDDAQKKSIVEAARDIAIVMAPNMSVGVNVALKLVDLATRALGPDYDIEVFEMHHKLKVDAPSGTALKLGEAAAKARGTTLERDGAYARHGVTGERKAGAIGFSVARGGDVVGDHTVYFAAAGERVEITHRATSRTNFAQGAIRAAKFLQARPAGLYDMEDVLGLR